MITEFDIFENNIPFPYFKYCWSDFKIRVDTDNSLDPIEVEIFFRSQYPEHEIYYLNDMDSVHHQYYNNNSVSHQVHIATEFNPYNPPTYGYKTYYPYIGFIIKTNNPTQRVTITNYDETEYTIDVADLEEIEPGQYKWIATKLFYQYSIAGNMDFKIRDIHVNLLRSYGDVGFINGRGSMNLALCM